MARSKCGNCGNSRFEMVEHEPAKSRFVLMFIQCSSCGTVVGVKDFRHIPALLDEQSKAIKKIARKVGVSVQL